MLPSFQRGPHIQCFKKVQLMSQKLEIYLLEKVRKVRVSNSDDFQKLGKLELAILLTAKS